MAHRSDSQQPGVDHTVETPGKREIIIDGTRIGDDTGCYVVAEIGHNHRGDLEECVELFAAAKDAGASAVKLQKREIRQLYTPSYLDRPYDSPHSHGATYRAHREALEFSRADFEVLQRAARDLGLCCFATPFDFASADLLAELGVPAFKLASGDIRSLPLVRHVARFGRPVFLSTGGSTIEDVERGVGAVLDVNPNLVVLQCTSSYPTADTELNLAVIAEYRRRCPGTVVGWSGHDRGIEFAAVAYALGARVIEKHFTLDRSGRGTDHAFSLEPPDLRAMVGLLERTRLALGDGKKRPYASEAAAMVKLGKKLVAARPLPEGHRLRTEDLEMRSPGDGIPPSELPALLGCRLLAALKEGETLRPELVHRDGAHGDEG